MELNNAERSSGRDWLRFRALPALVLLLLALPATGAHAQSQLAPAPASDNADQIVVFGRGETRVGVAGAASEGSVAGSDLLVRPLLRVAELLEAVPGMIAAQHSGSGKANQYFLRGFNLDHGTDFTTYIDGVQMNLRSHGHGQGYLDLNGLIPEAVEREDYRKGPYRADGGDFALAGAAYLRTVDRFDAPWVAVEAGSWGARRIAAGGSMAMPGDDGRLTLIGQIKTYDGPWQKAERLRHQSAFAKYGVNTGLGRLALSLHLNHARWDPTEQIPERAIGSAACPDVFCSPDPSARGRTFRAVAAATLEGGPWQATFGVQVYNWRMSSNPTYANADGSSAQIEQFDRRVVLTGNLHRNWHAGERIDLTFGVEGRHDAIGSVGLNATDTGRFVSSLGAYRVSEGSLATYGEATLRPAAGLRVIAGLRGDHYWFQARARDAAAAALGQGSGTASLASPKLALAYAPSPDWEFYANWGRGFHSNDVRGAVNRDSPVPVLVRGTGKELGLRWQPGPFHLTATYFWLDVGSELRFVGDANAVEPTGASRRRGYELVGFWHPAPWLALDASYTAAHSRYADGSRIPNAFKNALSAGASAVFDRWVANVHVRHLGPYPLDEGGQDRARGSTVVNVRAAWKPPHVELYAEVLNLADSRDKDITYAYESYLPGFDSAPTEGRMSRVIEPRTVRVGIKYLF